MRSFVCRPPVSSGDDVLRQIASARRVPDVSGSYVTAEFDRKGGGGARWSYLKGLRSPFWTIVFRRGLGGRFLRSREDGEESRNATTVATR